MQNPLLTYVKTTRTRRRDIAAAGGWQNATVGTWCKTVIPKLENMLALERITDGAVTVQQWTEYSQWLASQGEDEGKAA